MTQLEALKQEFEREVVTTRKMLSVIPSDKFDWQPHKKSMTVKQLATHIAELPTWIGMTLHTEELDFESSPYQPKELKNTPELLAYFERCAEEGRQELAGASEDQLNKPWTLRSGKTIYLTEPKSEMLRTTMSQVIHHRAQMGVFLRLLNVPIPGSYGPSADETF